MDEGSSPSVIIACEVEETTYRPVTSMEAGSSPVTGARLGCSKMVLQAAFNRRDVGSSPITPTNLVYCMSLIISCYMIVLT